MRNALNILLGITLWVLPCIVCWCLVAAAFFACRGTPPAAKLDPLVAAEPMSMEQFLTPPQPLGLLRAARVELTDLEPGLGCVRFIRPKTICEGAATPLPYMIPQRTPPQVGREWRCLFVTCVNSRPPEPDWFAWLIASTRPPEAGIPAELSPIGLPGCWLVVNPEALISIAPTDAAGAQAAQDAGALVQREPGVGRALLRWVPPAAMAGQKLWLQLMVAAPNRARRGFLLSHGLEVTVGG